MDADRLQFLLQRYFDELLTVEERNELSLMLLASARARDEFWELARWNALIRQWGEAEWGRRDAEKMTLRALPAPPAPRKSKVIAMPHPSTRRWSLALAAAAVLALFLIPAALLTWHRNRTDRSMSASVAILTHTAEAVWGEGSEYRQRGESLTPGWLRLKAGAVQIEFSRGARVVLEGPAELQLLTDNKVFLRSGKLRAQVPEPAHGFTVKTPEFTMVDYGTEFGCDLPLAGLPQVHVFRGLIGLRGVANAERQLQQNQAVQIESGHLKDIPARRDRFLSDEELARRERAGVNGRLTAWRAASRTLSEHPSALLHLDFEGDHGWARNLPNRAWRAVPDSPASMVGCEFADGRWPGKGAVEFNRPDDRLRLNLPGGYESLTLIAWLRVDSLSEQPQSLVMAEGLQTGDVQWSLAGGRLSFAVHIGKAGDTRGWRSSLSSAVIAPEMLGSWVCVASVFDGNTDTVTHYVNGQPVGSDRLGVRTLLQLEMFEIGNCAARSNDGPRNFRGRIDELAVLSAPLSAGEIRRIYDQGQVNESAGRPKSKSFAAQ